MKRGTITKTTQFSFLQAKVSNLKVIEGEVQRWAEGDQGKPDNQLSRCADRSSNPGIN